MVPLEPARSSRFSLGNVTAIVNNIFPLGILGTTIKGGLAATINVFYQDPLSLAKGLNSAVAFPFGINRFCHEANQRQYQSSRSSTFEKCFD